MINDTSRMPDVKYYRMGKIISDEDSAERDLPRSLTVFTTYQRKGKRKSLQQYRIGCYGSNLGAKVSEKHFLAVC